MFDEQESVRHSAPQTVDVRKVLTQNFGSIENPQFEFVDGSLGLIAKDQTFVAKAYHAPEFGLNPEDYGLSKQDLQQIRTLGLPQFLRNGGKLPDRRFVADYREKMQTFYDENKSNLNEHGSFQGKKATIVHNLETRRVEIFDSETKQLWSAMQLSVTQMGKYLNTGAIGVHGDILIAPGTIPPSQL